MNESVYYAVDAISDAITQNRQITYKYFEFNIKKERVYRHDGQLYKVSPFALVWDNENYYMLAWDSAAEKMKHYRVDKMYGVTMADEKREGTAAFEKTDMSAYTKSVFGMFGGNAEKVKLRFANGLAGAVIDRFGRDAMIIKDGEDHFTVTVDAVISDQFLAWVFAFGTRAEILSPENAREEMKKLAESVLGMY
jgi:predicted DNA-binding transcriptional regulator YafY